MFAWLRPGLAGAVGGPIARAHHPWGCFRPGAWKLVEVTTETFEENRTMTSLTETRTTLKGVDDEGVTLLIEVGVELAGKRFETQPYTVKQNWFGELAVHKMKVTELAESQVTVQDKEIPCRVFRLEIANAATRTVTKVYYSGEVEPFFLKRETVKSDAESGQVISRTTMEVVATGMPCTVLGHVRMGSQVKWVHEHANGKSTTVAVTSMGVPGGVICHTLKDFNKAGQLVRRSTLELVDYGFQPDEKRRGLFRRRRPPRPRKLDRKRAD